MSRHRDPLISVYISLLHGSTSPHTRFSRAASRPRAVRRRETADGPHGHPRGLDRFRAARRIRPRRKWMIKGKVPRKTGNTFYGMADMIGGQCSDVLSSLHAMRSAPHPGGRVDGPDAHAVSKKPITRSVHSLHSNAAPATASWLPWLPSAPPWPPSARPQTPPRQRHRARCASGQHHH